MSADPFYKILLPKTHHVFEDKPMFGELIDSLKQHGMNLKEIDIRRLSYYLGTALGFNPLKMCKIDLGEAKSLTFALIQHWNTDSRTFSNWDEDYGLFNAYHKGAKMWLEYLRGRLEFNKYIEDHTTEHNAFRMNSLKVPIDMSFKSFENYLAERLVRIDGHMSDLYNDDELITIDTKYGYLKKIDMSEERAIQMCMALNLLA